MKISVYKQTQIDVLTFNNKLSKILFCATNSCSTKLIMIFLIEQNKVKYMCPNFKLARLLTKLDLFSLLHICEKP